MKLNHPRRCWLEGSKVNKRRISNRHSNYPIHTRVGINVSTRLVDPTYQPAFNLTPFSDFKGWRPLSVCLLSVIFDGPSTRRAQGEPCPVDSRCSRKACSRQLHVPSQRIIQAAHWNEPSVHSANEAKQSRFNSLPTCPTQQMPKMAACRRPVGLAHSCRSWNCYNFVLPENLSGETIHAMF